MLATNVTYSVLLNFGGSAINPNLTATNAFKGVNSVLVKSGAAVGGVLLALAIVHLIYALSQEDASAKQKATLLFGASTIFLMMSTVVTTLIGTGITSSTSYKTVASGAIELLSMITMWAGVIMTAFTVINLIFAMIQEDAAKKAKASQSAIVSLGLISFSDLKSVLTIAISGGSGSTYDVNVNTIASGVISWFADIARIGGIFMVAFGVFNIVVSIKDEQSLKNQKAISMMVGGAFLVGLKSIFTSMGLL